MLADVAEKNLMRVDDGEDGKVGFADGRKGRLVVVDEEKPLERRRGLTRRGLRILTELIVRNENEGQLRDLVGIVPDGWLVSCWNYRMNVQFESK
jgi:hypothetical protein